MFEKGIPTGINSKDIELDAHIQYLIDKRMSAIEKNIEKLISKGLDKDKPKVKV